MIWALIHNGKYHGWYQIPFDVYDKITNPKKGMLWLLPITAIIKVIPK